MVFIGMFECFASPVSNGFYLSRSVEVWAKGFIFDCE